MATVNKDFKIKNGLVVEGTNATVNGNQILTETASDQYIIDLIGGETLITSVDADDFTVTGGELAIAVASDIARTGDIPTNTDGLTEGSTNLYYTDSRVDSHISGGDGINYSAGTISADVAGGLEITGGQIVVDRDTVDTWYDASGAASTAESNANTYTDTALEDYTPSSSLDATVGGYGYLKSADEYIQSVGTNLSVVDNELSVDLSSKQDALTAGTGIDFDGSEIFVDTTVIATKAYVDATAQGLDVKASVKAASTANIDLSAPYTGISGLATTLGDRVLLKDQTDSGENGIYVVGGSPLVQQLVRADDATIDAGATLGTLTNGSFTFVENGTHAGKGFVVSSINYAPVTEIVWTQFSETGNYITSVGTNLAVTGGELTVDLSSKQDELTAGTNIDITGSTISVAGLSSEDISDFSTAALSATASAYDAAGSAFDAQQNAEGYTDAQLTNYTTTANLETTIDGYGFAYTSELPTSSDDLTEGINNLYYTDLRAKSQAANLLTGAIKNNIEITYDTLGQQLTITAENGVADSTTDDLAEGETNLYFENSRAIDAITNATIHPVALSINDYRKEEATQQYVVSASTVDVHSFEYPYESVKYLVRVVGNVTGTKHSQLTEILMTVDGNGNIALTEYGTVCTDTNNLASFSATMAGGSTPTLTATTAVSGCEIIAAATMLSWAD